MTQTVYRFSESPIWELQRAYFEEQGIKAWQSEEVPQYITSNPVVAMAYAEMIFGFLQDRAGSGYSSEPVTIVELGAGSGRLAFHILKQLSELIDYAGLPLPPFRYVMSDLAESNISYWQQHSRLAPFVEQGCLDFAVFDAVQDAELRLTQSDTIIRPGDLKQPLLIVANYFFDSIPQELIYVDEGNIYECRVSYQFPDGEVAVSDKLAQAVPEYHYYRASEYEQELYPYRSVIELYQRKLEDSHVLFPVSGLGCLDRLGKLSQAGFVLITADKGDHRLENWQFAEPPKLIHHGSFSLTANYHAISAFYEQQGAKSYFTAHHYRNLNVGCLLNVQAPGSYMNTRLAYRRFVDRYGPDDFFSMKQWFDEHLDQLELSQIYSFWRLGGYDSQLFLQSAKRISALLDEGDEEQWIDLRSGIQVMWEGYYQVEERQHLAVDCGMLLYQIEQFEEALLFFERSLAEGHQPDTEQLYRMAICCYELENEAGAAQYAEHVIAVEPEHEEALELLASLE